MYFKSNEAMHCLIDTQKLPPNSLHMHIEDIIPFCEDTNWTDRSIFSHVGLLVWAFPGSKSFKYLLYLQSRHTHTHLMCMVVYFQPSFQWQMHMNPLDNVIFNASGLTLSVQVRVFQEVNRFHSRPHKDSFVSELEGGNHRFIPTTYN